MSLELGDFDNDGDLDAFIVEEVYAGDDGSGTVYDEDAVAPEAVSGRVWTNNGNGSFGESPQTLNYGVVPTSPYTSADFSVTAADINGDGSLDVVTGDFTAAKIWFNNAAPTLTVTNATVVVAQNAVGGNSGLVSDSSYDSLTLAASIGTVTNNGDGTWSWFFDTNDGPDQSQTVTITATDAQGLTSTATFAQVVNNLAPVIAAVNTSVTVNEGATAFMTGTISDAGQDVVTLSASSSTVTDNGDGTWNWLFDTNDGPDDFRTVTITATDGASATTSFALTVNNVAPTVSATSSTVTVNEGQTATNTGSFGDAGLDTVTLTASTGTVTNNGNGT